MRERDVMSVTDEEIIEKAARTIAGERDDTPDGFDRLTARAVIAAVRDDLVAQAVEDERERCLVTVLELPGEMEECTPVEHDLLRWAADRLREGGRT